MASTITTTPIPGTSPSTRRPPPKKKRVICHTYETSNRAFCGVKLSGNGVHSRSECSAAGHEHCEPCDILSESEGGSRGDLDRG